MWNRLVSLPGEEFSRGNSLLPQGPSQQRPQMPVTPGAGLGDQGLSLLFWDEGLRSQGLWSYHALWL